MSSKTYTVADVAAHNKKDDAWVIIDGKVYDVTKFLSAHPGGSKVLLKACGKDASSQFATFHGPNVMRKYGPKLCIGDVSPSSKL